MKKAIQITCAVGAEPVERMRRIVFSISLAILLAVSAIFLLAPLDAQAGTPYRWIPVGDFVYNWTSSNVWWTEYGGGHYGPPVFGDTATIRRLYAGELSGWGPSPYKIEIEATTLYIGSDDLSNAGNAGNAQHLYLTERSTGGTSNGTQLTVGNLKVGWTTAGDVTVNHHSRANEQSHLLTNSATVGYGFLGDGEVTLTGKLSQWSASNTTYLGHTGGDGAIDISNKARLETDRAYIGYSSGNSTGVVDISDLGSVWVADGATILGYSAGSEGEVNIDAKAGMYLGSSLSIGRYGDGVLDVASYGLLTDDNPPAGFEGGGGGDDHPQARIYLGEYSGSDGRMSVHDSGSGNRSRLENSGTVYAGYRGIGIFSVYGGALADVNNVTVGMYSGATGSVGVNHQNSNWNQTGTLVVGNSGGGTFYAEGGAQLETVDVVIGKESSGQGAVWITGVGSSQTTDWESTGAVTVGQGGTGELNVSDYGQLTSDSGMLGGLSAGDGTVNVGGAEAKWLLKNDLVVGGAGSAALNIEDAGVVTLTSLGNEMILTEESGSDAAVTVTGSGSRLSNSGVLMEIGRGGTAVVDILDSGYVYSNSDIDIGVLSGSVGTVNLNGNGSNLRTDGSLNVGLLGLGTVNVANGADLASIGGVLDSNGTQTGVVDLAGNGVVWTNSGGLTVGNSGLGELTVRTGARATVTGDAVVGNLSGSQGTVTVDGEDSLWWGKQNMHVGYYGAATVDILDGGLLSCDQVVHVASRNSSVSAVTVDGSESLLGTATLVVGDYGHGAVAVKNGGRIASDTGYKRVPKNWALV
ncbi:MAG: hypothetical protein QGH60_21515 [Phycisphaerae bacterium]|nr:hypothetical protein [Phycisphaerae bacterium]